MKILNNLKNVVIKRVRGEVITMAKDKFNITVSMRVEGLETMDASLSFQGTDLEQVIRIEQAVIGTFANLLTKQEKGEI